MCDKGDMKEAINIKIKKVDEISNLSIFLFCNLLKKYEKDTAIKGDVYVKTLNGSAQKNKLMKINTYEETSEKYSIFLSLKISFLLLINSKINPTAVPKNNIKSLENKKKSDHKGDNSAAICNLGSCVKVKFPESISQYFETADCILGNSTSPMRDHHIMVDIVIIPRLLNIELINSREVWLNLRPFPKYEEFIKMIAKIENIKT